MSEELVQHFLEESTDRTAMRYLGGMDTMFVRAETRSMLLHVTGVLILDPATSRIDPPTGP